MIRLAVLLTFDEAQRLQNRAEELGISRSELLRASGIPGEDKTPMTDVKLPADLIRELLRALGGADQR